MAFGAGKKLFWLIWQDK